MVGPPTNLDGRARLSAPDAAGARTYRQHLIAGRRPLHIVFALAAAWFLVAGLVFAPYVPAGPGAVGRIILGLVIWIVPLVAIVVPVMVGPRGPFRDWFWPRLIVRADDDGLAWWTEGSVRRPEDTLAWSAVATVGPTLPSRGRPPGADCALSGADGQLVARLPCRLVRIDRPASRRWRRVVWLPDVAVAVRPDRYRRRRVVGRRATLRDPDADATA
jgi:hypothetical protein